MFLRLRQRVGNYPRIGSAQLGYRSHGADLLLGGAWGRSRDWQTNAEATSARLILFDPDAAAVDFGCHPAKGQAQAHASMGSGLHVSLQTNVFLEDPASELGWDTGTLVFHPKLQKAVALSP